MITLPPNNLSHDRNLYIRELQTFLRKIAQFYPAIPLVNVDGIFGPKTTEAVSGFQRRFHLPVTGQVNEATWNAIVSEYRRLLNLEAAPVSLNLFPSNEAVLRQGDSGDAVYALQLMLNTLATQYNNIKPVAVTGIMNPATALAVKDMQKHLSLEESGNVNRETWDGIARLYNNL